MPVSGPTEFFAWTSGTLFLSFIGQMIHISYLRKDRDDLRVKLYAERCANRKLVEDAQKHGGLESYAEFARGLGKIEPLPTPEPDPFLEMADLRRQLDQGRVHSKATEDRLLAKLDENDALKRSNAALRGQITKLSGQNSKMRQGKHIK
jgi:hypothetical protein